MTIKLISILAFLVSISTYAYAGTVLIQQQLNVDSSIPVYGSVCNTNWVNDGKGDLGVNCVKLTGEAKQLVGTIDVKPYTNDTEALTQVFCAWSDHAPMVIYSGENWNGQELQINIDLSNLGIPSGASCWATTQIADLANQLFPGGVEDQLLFYTNP